MLGWSQDELATAASISRATIATFERGERLPTGSNLASIREAFEAAGIVFIPENGGGAGVRMRDRESDAGLN